MMAKAGRKPTYTEEDRERIVKHILAELSGGRAVSRILREDAGMPAASLFWQWHFTDETLQEKVARARENGVEAIMDETLEIADNTSNDTIRNEAGVDQANTEWITRSRLRVDTRHKYAQMIAPRKYGPKLDLTSGGEKLGLTAELEAARRRVAGDKTE
jgi:hypothetical protein